MDASSSVPHARPLAGKCVVITRPQGLGANAEESDVLAERLTQWGAQVSRIPLIEVRAIPWRLEATNTWNWLFFTSKNAVHAFYSGIESYRNQVQSARIAVVGPATGEVLAIYGQQPDFTAPRFDAESAARAFCETHDCQGLQVLWPCGNLANPELPHILHASGARVMPLTVYETVLRTQLSPDEVALLGSGVDMVVLASTSAVAAFRHVHQSLALKTLPAIACLGPKTAEAALMHLGRVDVQPTNAATSALAEDILAFYRQEAAHG